MGRRCSPSLFERNPGQDFRCHIVFVLFLLLTKPAVDTSRQSHGWVFVSTEDAAPPLPSNSTNHYVHENGLSPTVSSNTPPPPAVMEKPKRSAAARGIEDVRPSVESLLDELESSVPVPM